MFEGKDRTDLAVKMTVYRQVFALLPALDSAHLAVEVNRNFLPGVEAVPRIFEMRRRIWFGTMARQRGWNLAIKSAALLV
jgi:hypothetical protein